ncbi:unnamed protein product, partial [Symbiodinium sp. CCMP2456]
MVTSELEADDADVRELPGEAEKTVEQGAQCISVSMPVSRIVRFLFAVQVQSIALMLLAVAVDTFAASATAAAFAAFVEKTKHRARGRTKGAGVRLEFFALPAKDREGEPRPLTWEEALVDFLPIGATVRGVIQELRPYGSFIGLIVNGMAMGKFGEDSRIRGFCEDLQSSSDPAQLQVGEHVAVKILDVDMVTKRVFVSTREADPPWPPPRERVLHTLLVTVQNFRTRACNVSGDNPGPRCLWVRLPRARSRAAVRLVCQPRGQSRSSSAACFRQDADGRGGDKGHAGNSRRAACRDVKSQSSAGPDFGGVSVRRAKACASSERVAVCNTAPRQGCRPPRASSELAALRNPAEGGKATAVDIRSDGARSLPTLLAARAIGQDAPVLASKEQQDEKAAPAKEQTEVQEAILEATRRTHAQTLQEQQEQYESMLEEHKEVLKASLEAAMREHAQTLQELRELYEGMLEEHKEVQQTTLEAAMRANAQTLQEQREKYESLLEAERHRAEEAEANLAMAENAKEEEQRETCAQMLQ